MKLLSTDWNERFCSSFTLGFKQAYKFWSNFFQEFNIEKLQLVEAEKRKIIQEYERKEKQVEVQKKMKEDLELVEAILQSAKHEYAKKVGVHPPEIIVDFNVHMLPPSDNNSLGPFCSRGVVLASRDGKIVFENTLDAMLDVVFRKKLLEIRKLLFSQAAA